MRVREIRSLEDLSLLKNRWEELESESPCPNPYISFAWISSYLEVFRRGTPLILVAEIEGRICALAALEITKARFLGCSYKIISFAGTGNTGTDQLSLLGKLFSYDNRLCWSDKLDFLWDSNCPEAVTAIVEYLRNSDQWDLLDLREMAPEAICLSAIKEGFSGDHFRLEEFVATKSGYISLPTSMEEFIKGLSRNLRKNVKRSRERMGNEFGEVSLKVYEDKWEVERLMPRVIALESKSWKGTDGVGAFSQKKNREFHEKLAEQFSEKEQFSLFILEVEGGMLSYMFTFHDNKALHFHNMAISPEYKQYSPGIAIIMKAIERSISEGVAEVFVGRGDDYFINALLTGRQDRVWLKVYKNNFHMRLLRKAEFSWAPALKKLKSKIKNRNIDRAQAN